MIRFKTFIRSPKMWIYLFFLFGPRIIIDEVIAYSGNQTKNDLNAQTRMFMIRIQTLIYCLASGFFIYVLGSDFQSQKRYVMKFMGLRTLPYYVGYFISDYIFYMIPNLIIIVVCDCSFVYIFTDY